jgi:hypothetical protein
MISIIERYLAVRRATGFELMNTEYLLRSFARWAAQRGETHIRSESAVAWASQTASVAQRDARLKTICLFARYLRPEDPGMNYPPRITLVIASAAAFLTSTPQWRSGACSMPPRSSDRRTPCSPTPIGR